MAYWERAAKKNNVVSKSDQLNCARKSINSSKGFWGFCLFRIYFFFAEIERGRKEENKLNDDSETHCSLKWNHTGKADGSDKIKYHLSCSNSIKVCGKTSDTRHFILLRYKLITHTHTTDFQYQTRNGLLYMILKHDYFFFLLSITREYKINTISIKKEHFKYTLTVSVCESVSFDI